MNYEEQIGELLHANGLKKTPIRTEMLSLFMSHEFALSASDIMARMKAENDRVTVYRALACFEEQGILHKASEDGHGAKYALCDHGHPNEIPKQHVHFVCDQCLRTYCLNDLVVPEVEISDEFKIDRVEYILRGICKVCKA